MSDRDHFLNLIREIRAFSKEKNRYLQIVELIEGEHNNIKNIDYITSYHYFSGDFNSINLWDKFKEKFLKQPISRTLSFDRNKMCYFADKIDTLFYACMAYIENNELKKALKILEMIYEEIRVARFFTDKKIIPKSELPGLDFLVKERLPAICHNIALCNHKLNKYKDAQQWLKFILREDAYSG